MPLFNVILLVCHDLGRHLGCYGVETVNTPNLDRLAAQGVRFANHFCTAPSCSPSRAAIMTGRYPHSNGMMGLAHKPFNWTLHPTERHLAAIMRDAGFDTVLAGVQHETQHPETLGYAEIIPQQANCVETAKLLGEWLGTRRGAAKPFYACLGFFEPHRRFDHGGAKPDDSKGVWVPPYLVDSPATRADLAALQGAIRRADEGVGVLMEALARTGLDRETLVVFTTDHGIAFPRAKCTLYDPGTGTALIMRHPGFAGPKPGYAVASPGLLKAGDVRDELLSNVDLLPTLLDLLGGADIPVCHDGGQECPPHPIQGRSFAALLAGGRYQKREAIFTEKTFHTYYDPMRAVRTERWKLIVNFEESHRIEAPSDILQSGSYLTMIPSLPAHRDDVELYDLASDPNETTNLAGKPEHADIERKLLARLHTHMVETDDPLLKGPVVSPTYRAVRALVCETGKKKPKKRKEN